MGRRRADKPAAVFCLIVRVYRFWGRFAPHREQACSYSSVSYTGLVHDTNPVGAWLAREEALKIAKSFAGKPGSYSFLSYAARVYDTEL
ncbi:hypothetical protein C3F00_012945 [Pseudomonas sp. MWU13-2860]|nr:hypothetical protein C3F00_012945 [Pseudomonas sp. MWU13-2860]